MQNFYTQLCNLLSTERPVQLLYVYDNVNHYVQLKTFAETDPVTLDIYHINTNRVNRVVPAIANQIIEQLNNPNFLDLVADKKPVHGYRPN